MVWTILVLILTAVDQLTKVIIRRDFALGESRPVLEGFFYLTHRENRGGAWSLFSGQEWGIYLLTAVSAVMAVVFVFLIWKVRDRLLRVILCVILAGDLGNLIDRFRFGVVTDFLDFHFGSYIFPTFNAADSYIVCGSIALGLLLLFKPDLHILDLLKLRADPSANQRSPRTEQPSELTKPEHPSSPSQSNQSPVDPS